MNPGRRLALGRNPPPGSGAPDGGRPRTRLAQRGGPPSDRGARPLNPRRGLRTRRGAGRARRSTIPPADAIPLDSSTVARTDVPSASPRNGEPHPSVISRIRHVNG
ncbi:hypothetical protein CP971_14125 [Streptomyces viridifaciens]|nr:hypothetical protein CP971_14125 [Streptomyces viridifaciens]